MEQKDLSVVVSAMTENINEIKLNTEILVTKLEQVNVNIEKIEASVEDLHMSLSEQDRRLTVVEQMIPQNLIQDIAIIKQSQDTFSRLFWILGGATLSTFVDMIYHLILK
jgi:hypothetical protein